MKNWRIELSDITEYEISAENPEEACEQAMEWWIERIPNIVITELKREENENE